MPAKKKTIKNTKKRTKTIENQLDNIESNIDEHQKVLEEQRRQAKQEELRQNKIDEKIDSIREDLKTQLINQNKFGKHFDDQVEDYLFFIRVKEDLQNDIKINGIRYKAMTGNGYKTDKPNESVQNLVKVNAQMLKILQELDLKEPEENPEAGDDNDLL